MESFWNSHNLNEAQELLDYLLDKILPEGGFSFSIKSNIALHEFINSPKNKLNKGIVLKSLKFLKEKGLNTLESFQKIYKEQLILFHKRKISERHWTFYIPLYIDFATKLPINISLLNHKLTLTNSVPYKKNIFNNSHIQINNYGNNIKNTISDKNSVFLKLSGNGEDYYQTWLKLNLPFDVFRGLLEFSFNCFGFRWGGEGKPHSKIPHPQWMLIRDDKNNYDVTTFITEEYKPISKFKLESRHISIIRKNSRILKIDIPKNSSINLLINALRLYSDAMDAIYPYHRFLSMWQIAESLTIANEFRGNSEKVAKRLAHFAKYIDLISTGYINILKSLSQKRNDIVHQGISNVDEDDINHLKLAIDSALLWYFQNVSKIKTKEHISNYFNLLEMSNDKIKTLTESISYLSKKA